MGGKGAENEKDRVTRERRAKGTPGMLRNSKHGRDDGAAGDAGGMILSMSSTVPPPRVFADTWTRALRVHTGCERVYIRKLARAGNK